MKYLLDANVFIEAKNRYYAFDICPGFWDWMDYVVEDGKVMSIAPVRDELLAGKDELADWVEARKNEEWFNAVSDTKTQKNFSEIAAWVQASPYREPAKAKFLSGADPWLIAKAMTIGAKIVTHEVAEPNARRRIPLPNVCDQFSVGWANTFDLLRKLEASFSFRATSTQGTAGLERHPT